MTISIKKIRPYAKILLLAAAIAAGVYVFFFLKYYFYPTLAGTETISLLQENMSIQVVDVDKFNDLVDKISQKTSTSSEPSSVNDPF